MLESQLFKEQVKLEKEMVSFGAARYKAAQESVSLDKKAGGAYIVQTSLNDLTSALENKYESATVGRNVRALTELTEYDDDKVRRPIIPADAAMYITIATMLNGTDDDMPFVKMATTTASAIEDEIRFTQFKESHGNYYETLQSGFSKRGSVDYRYKHRVLTDAANKVDGVGDGWVPWTPQVKVLVGTFLLDIVLNNTEFFVIYDLRRRGNKGYTKCVGCSQLTLDLLQRVDEFRMFLDPAYMPMIVPPRPWTSNEEGGYYTPAASSRYPFVKPSYKSDTHAAQLIVNSGGANKVLEAVNRIQATPWKVNTDVYDVLKRVYEGGYGVGLPSSTPIDIPKWHGDSSIKVDDMDEETLLEFNEWKQEATVAHTQERHRHSKCRIFLRTLTLTEKFKDYANIYFPHNCDFRGRFYCASSGLSIQGDDIGKSLLHFGNTQKLTERGAYWLGVQGANVYGEDKLNFDERNQWAIDNTDAIRASAQDPIANRDFWGNADKPWQFLAFCIEWEGYCVNGLEHMTRLPVALDGSCNGLQHYSALLRDTDGAIATNLIGTDLPADIYQRVADCCTSKLTKAIAESADPDARAALEFWQTVYISRKLAKKPVMTLPYGSTRITCADSIQDWLKEYDYGVDAVGRIKLSWALTPLLWDAIGETVVAARVGMNWLQQASRELARKNEALMWRTVLGFPIIQRTRHSSAVRVRTTLSGEVFRPVVSIDTNRIDSRKQASGIAPNFTHGNDATHLAMTVLENGECDYAMIHDSFGCHANGIDKLHTSIRTAFYDMYAKHDIIQNFIDDTGTTIEAPATGDFDLEQIHKATYFFG